MCNLFLCFSFKRHGGDVWHWRCFSFLSLLHWMQSSLSSKPQTSSALVWPVLLWCFYQVLKPDRKWTMDHKYACVCSAGEFTLKAVTVIKWVRSDKCGQVTSIMSVWNCSSSWLESAPELQAACWRDGACAGLIYSPNSCVFVRSCRDQGHTRPEPGVRHEAG